MPRVSVRLDCELQYILLKYVGTVEELVARIVRVRRNGSRFH